MAEIIDDTATFTVQALTGPTAAIDNVVAPTTVQKGVSFTVEYDVQNTGQITGNMFGRMIDATDPDNETTITGSDWTEDLDGGATKHVTHEFTDGIQNDITVRIEAGHNE